jgi:chromosome segregation ATPase
MNENSLLSEEGKFIDLKGEMEDFLKSLTDQSLQEFKGLLSIIFHSLKTSFDNVSMYQRQLNDTQEKLKRHIRNKNEIIKNIEDDNERFSNLKNETENLYLKIDNLKHEEGEKDKEIKILNEEIIKLNQRNDQENLSNFKPPELDIKQKLIQEREEYDSKISFLEAKKNQQMMLLNSLTDETRKSEQIGKDLEEKYRNLQKEIKDQQDLLDGEKTSKENSDKQFLNLRQENQDLKEQIINLQDEEKLILDENDKFSKIHIELSDDYNKKKTELNTLKVKIVPEMKSKLSEYERKNEECKKVLIKIYNNIQ